MTVKSDAKIDRIKDLSLFGGANAKALEHIASVADEVTLKPGHVLIEQDHFHHEMFIIEKGTAEVTVDGEIVAEIPEGEALGEVSFLAPGPSSATVRAATELEVLVISYNHLQVVVDENPAMMLGIAKELAHRLRDMDERHR